MRRLLAALLAVFCLTFFALPVFAEPAEDEQTQDTPTDPETPEAETPDSGTQEQPQAPAPSESETTAAQVLAGTTHISKLESNVTMGANGKVSMVQTVQVSFASSLTRIRFGLPADAQNGKVEGYKFKTSEQDGVRYLTVENAAGFTGVQTFTLRYTQTGVVLQEGEQQTLTLPLLAPQDYRIASFAFNVTMPQSFESAPSFSSGYLGEQFSDTLHVSSQSSVITGVFSDMVQDHEAVTMTLLLPKGYFSGNHSNGAPGVVLTLVVFGLAALTVLYWWRTLRNAPLRVQARTLPPDGVNPGDVPYLLSGGDADFNMLVSHWATLGYVSFHITVDGNVLLLRRMGMGNERRKYERKLFELLFDGTDRCDGASMRYKRVGEKAMGVIPRYWNRRLFHRRSGSPTLARLLSCLVCALATLMAMDTLAPVKLHGLLLVLAFVAGFALCWLLHGAFGCYYLSQWGKMSVGIGSGILLLLLGGAGGASLVMVPAVVLAVFIGWQTVRGGLRSPYGDQVMAQTMGFRRFLHNASEHHIMQMLRRDPQYFYKMLPYAQSMGQGRHFVGLFHDVQMEPCQWYEAEDGTPLTASGFYAHYCESLEMLNVSIRR